MWRRQPTARIATGIFDKGSCRHGVATMASHIEYPSSTELAGMQWLAGGGSSIKQALKAGVVIALV